LIDHRKKTVWPARGSLSRIGIPPLTDNPAVPTRKAMANIPRPPPVAGLGALAGDYRALLCDVWGVVHNGVRAFPAATDALVRFRAAGGKVVLLTNAPVPKSAVAARIAPLGVPEAAYDDIVTSGEVARAILAERGDARVLHVGPDRDLPLYDGLTVRLVAEAECELISCTGLFNDVVETPDDYATRIGRWRARNLPMVCANPDRVVERGDRLVWCAGAIADRYRAAGGPVTVVGKPHPAIYVQALALLDGTGPVLALGDGVETDVRGAVAAGLDVVFVTGGIHAAEFGARGTPDLAAVHAQLAKAGLGARAVMTRLAY
jgi:HAD superfamily hydrolase (TIGR01459 family)